MENADKSIKVTSSVHKGLFDQLEPGETFDDILRDLLGLDRQNGKLRGRPRLTSNDKGFD